MSIKKGRYVIIANHKSAIDPYLILATLPFDVYRTFLPIRFFTANIYLRHWWQRYFLLPFGCFRAYSTEGKLSGVKGAIQLSDREQTLFIFPEGKRVKPNAKAEIKVGIGYLAQRRNFTIIPVHLNYNKGSRLRKTQVFWGKPFKVTSSMKIKGLDVLSKHIFRKVERLAKLQ